MLDLLVKYLATRVSNPLITLLILALTHSSIPTSAQNSFADPSFAQLWERTDAPVLSSKVTRSWYWGPGPGQQLQEPYSGSQTGTRLVQYFDKARMEINDPQADRSSEWFVTTGLLVVDMVSGKQQVGDKEFVPRRAAELAVGGDGYPHDLDAPSYTSFRPVTSLGGPGSNRAPSRVGEALTATLNRAGQVGTATHLGLYPGAKVAAYSDVLGHNIPQAMWDFLNLKGPVQQGGRLVEGGTIANWIFVMGYPISEAYWARVRIEGVYYDVLFQMYERRSLAYIPGFPQGWQVQMGNVGQHYHRWLYGGPLPTPIVPIGGSPPVPTTATPSADASASAIATTTATRTPTRVPTSTPPRGSVTPTATLPPVPTQPAGGLILSVRPGFGPPDAQFTFSARGLAPNEGVQVTFIDPNGSRLYPNGGNGRYTADAEGNLSITLVPRDAFPSAPLGNWLFELAGLGSGQEGIIGFTLR